MKQLCAKCKKPLNDGDRIKAVVLSIFHEISSSVTYAMEQPYDCLSMEHLDCRDAGPKDN